MFLALISEAVMKCKKVTAAEVELEGREWFRLARDRKGSRKRRATNAREQPQN